MYSRVLQLDAHGEPMGMVDWNRACAMLWNGNAELLAHDPGTLIRSQSWQTPAPLVIQLPHARADYVKLDDDKLSGNVVRSILYARDNWQCQYCAVEVDHETASIDHVRPVWLFVEECDDPVAGRLAATTWENVVTCCKLCNYIKGGLLPMECGMYPMHAPRRPSYVKLWANRRYHPVQAEYVAEWCKIDRARLRVTRLPVDFDWDRAWSEKLERLLAATGHPDG
jgi:5-methylcytosine-specific restriction endonuclease McrA